MKDDKEVFDLWTTWTKQFMWGVNHPDPEVLRALLSYMVICLSRGRVPDPQLVDDFLSDKRTVPPCGYVTCVREEEHVH